MSKRITTVLVMVVMLVSILCVAPTYSWFTITKEVKSGDFQMGKLDYALNGKFIGIDGQVRIIVPSDSLLETPITITNQSTIQSFLKMRIDAKISNDVSATDSISGLELLDITLNTPSNWTADPLDNGLYYYGGSPTGSEIPIPTGIQTINFIDSIKLSQTVDKTYAGKYLKIKVTLFARQSTNMTWETIGEIDYATGIAPPLP